MTARKGNRPVTSTTDRGSNGRTPGARRVSASADGGGPHDAASATASGRRRIPAVVGFSVAVVMFVTVMAAAGAPSTLLVVYQKAWHFADWELTVAFSVYAVTLLLALLILGSLADHIGRKPMMLGSLLLQIVSLLLFLLSTNVGGLTLARAVQGVATGAATIAFSAYISEAAPVGKKKLGALFVSVASFGGMGIGAILTGVAIQISPHPDEIVFGTAACLLAAGLLVLIFAPDTVEPVPGAIKSLIPGIKIPPVARRTFLSLTPGLIGVWMAAGLVLGLAASIATQQLHVADGIPSGVLVGIQPVTATVATLVLAPRLDARRLLMVGYASMLAGVCLEIASFWTSNAIFMIVGASLAGVGFGSTFSASLSALVPLARPHERGGMFSAFYFIGYLAYGVPTVFAGLLADLSGLLVSATVYASVIIAVMAAALAGWIAHRSRSADSTSRLPGPTETSTARASENGADTRHGILERAQER